MSVLFLAFEAMLMIDLGMVTMGLGPRLRCRLEAPRKISEFKFRHLHPYYRYLIWLWRTSQQTSPMITGSILI